MKNFETSNKLSLFSFQRQPVPFPLGGEGESFKRQHWLRRILVSASGSMEGDAIGFAEAGVKPMGPWW